MGLRSERILITGSTGFTGRPLAKRLREDGHDVLALSRDATEPHALNVDLCDFDATARALTEARPSAVVHLAGIAAATHANVSEIYAANVLGTAHLFRALESAGIEPRLVIIASSGQVYAAPDAKVAITEDAPLAPTTHYAVSKRAMEEIAAVYARQFPVIVTRPFNYTGPGQSPNFLVAKIVYHYAAEHAEIRLGNLDLYRDISDIGRVVEAYARLLSLPVDPATINICSGRAVHLADILQIMDEISGYRLRVVTDPSLVRANEPRFIVGSPARLETLVGPLPNPDFRETLKHMYGAFRRELGKS